MGLDISFYRQLRRVNQDVEDDECRYVHLWGNHPSLADRGGSLAPGYYEASEDGDSFRAGSYGGYNHWRAELAGLVGVTPEAVWAAPDKHTDTPFVELINFSDCEGYIGPEVAAKLARDFAEWDERARLRMDEYSYAKYRDWRTAFETAADGGAVCFH